MANFQTPSMQGFFWAKATPETQSAHEMLNEWTIVEVFENTIDKKHPEHLRVFILGFTDTFGLECFIWGPRIHKPRDLQD